MISSTCFKTTKGSSGKWMAVLGVGGGPALTAANTEGD